MLGGINDTGDIMSQDDFDWLSCEDSIFVGVVYDLTMQLHLWEPEREYDKLVLTAPDKAYVLVVYHRTHMLVNRFESLNLIHKLLAVETLPIPTSVGAIGRESWTRIVLDVLLSRLTSIRDCAYLLISEVFELNLTPIKVSRRSLKSNPVIPASPFHEIIDDLADIGRDFRDERNYHFHQGEERDLGEDAVLYYAASIIESWGQAPTVADQFGQPIDWQKKHQQVIDQIRAEFIAAAKQLEDAVLLLFNSIYPQFLERVRYKHAIAKKSPINSDNWNPELYIQRAEAYEKYKNK